MTMPRENSDTANDDILNVLKAILGLIRWVGIPVLVGTGGLIVVMVADHYQQIGLAEDRDYMKPRVVKLWQEKHPEEMPLPR